MIPGSPLNAVTASQLTVCACMASVTFPVMLANYSGCLSQKPVSGHEGYKSEMARLLLFIASAIASLNVPVGSVCKSPACGRFHAWPLRMILASESPLCLRASSTKVIIFAGCPVFCRRMRLPFAAA